MKFYLGYNPLDGDYHHFKADEEPTNKSHGKQFSHCWGPFKTKRGAEFARKYWKGNPHTTTVSAVERIAKAEVGK